MYHTYFKIIVLYNCNLEFNSRDLKQLGWERQRRRLLNFQLSIFPSCLYNSCVSFLFCLKVCEYEKLEALFLKVHED